MQKASDSTATEEQLVQLLATLRVETTREVGFEDRFLYDFHERVAQAAVVRPARYQLWEHLMQALTNFGGRRLAYGASSLGIGAFAVAFFALPQDGPRSAVAAAALNRLDNSITTLTPGLSRDFDNCTTIRVEKAKNPFAHESSLAVSAERLTEDVNIYTSSTASASDTWEAAAQKAMMPAADAFSF